eukprot:CAMPEP_0197843218 /NCGR_PEP_ID=MMETSP1438-20131217/44_1 /TAXON_ID=1461541 /ORGANISM="Pterosperma sp., Strain CCMP1384" /LENGTH=88 /DNA_ID=CAMNT_0043453215 /DNA_START=36 /DNA_END=298 /DNA_ORIENTATION=-
MTANSIIFSDEEFDAWHGANKVEVIRHFYKKSIFNGVYNGKDEAFVQDVYAQFQAGIKAAYFSDDSPITAIPGAVSVFRALRAQGIKV